MGVVAIIYNSQYGKSRFYTSENKFAQSIMASLSLSDVSMSTAGLSTIH